MCLKINVLRRKILAVIFFYKSAKVHILCRCTWNARWLRPKKICLWNHEIIIYDEMCFNSITIVCKTKNCWLSILNSAKENMILQYPRQDLLEFIKRRPKVQSSWKKYLIWTCLEFQTNDKHFPTNYNLLRVFFMKFLQK